MKTKAKTTKTNAALEALEATSSMSAEALALSAAQMQLAIVSQSNAKLTNSLNRLENLILESPFKGGNFKNKIFWVIANWRQIMVLVEYLWKTIQEAKNHVIETFPKTED